MSILIADSGSTTAEWALITDDSPTQLMTTTGINPVHQHDETIQRIIADELCPVMRKYNPDISISMVPAVLVIKQINDSQLC